jgi:hypothetical protein
MILAGRGFALSWVNDLSSILGIPKGAATLAAAIYVGSAKGAWAVVAVEGNDGRQWVESGRPPVPKKPVGERCVEISIRIYPFD